MVPHGVITQTFDLPNDLLLISSKIPSDTDLHQTTKETCVAVAPHAEILHIHLRTTVPNFAMTDIPGSIPLDE